MLATGCTKTESYTVKGEITRVNSEQVLTIKHEKIPGFMEAMTMPFELEKPGMAAGYIKGDKIEFTFQKVDDGWPITSLKKLE